MASDDVIDHSWLTRHPVEAAWHLIGCELRLARDGVVVAGRIVETEAYAGPLDPASHASRLRIAREVMAGPPGTIYVYLSYGIHTMLNIVAHREGESGGVLLRAVEPTEGLEAMRERRGGVEAARLARGPGSLGQAFGVRLADLGTDMIDTPAWQLVHGDVRGEVRASPRIGISRAVHAPWRFFEHPSAWVSRHRTGERVDREDVVRLIPLAGTPIE